MTKITEAKNQEDKIRLLVSYLDDLEPKDKKSENLNTFLSDLQKSEPLLESHINFNKQIIAIQSNPDSKQRISEYNKLMNFYKKKNKTLFEGVCLLQISQQQLNLKQYDIALRNAITANELLKKVGYNNIPEIGKYLHSLALTHFFFKDYNQVIDLMNESYKHPLFSENMDVQRDNNKANAYIGLNQKDKAQTYFLKALHKAEKYNNHIWVGLLSGNIGEIFENKKEYFTALDYYNNGLKHIEAKKVPGVYRNFLLKIAKNHLNVGNIKQAKSLLDSFEEVKDKEDYFLGIQQQEEKNRQLYYEVCKLYYQKTENFSKAYVYADSLYMFAAKQDSIYNKLNIDISYYKLNNEKYFLELQLKETEKKQIIYRYIIVLFLISAISVAGYFYMKRRKDKQKKLFLLREESMKEKKNELKKEINTLKKDIDSHLRKITENNRLLEKYKAELQKSGNNEEDTRINIDNLKILTKEHWDNFLNDFKKSNKRFYNKIVKLLPDLTQSEQRFLFLLKLGISQKDLPNVIGTSDVNVRVTLHRLKSKIQSKEQNPDLQKLILLLNNK